MPPPGLPPPRPPARPPAAAGAGQLTSPKEEWGHNVGDDYFLANYQQLDRLLAQAREAVDPHSRRRDRQDGREPAAADGDHHVAGELREARSLQGDLAPARADAEGPDRRRRRARSRRKASRSSGSTAVCTRPKSLGAQQLLEMVYQMVSPHGRGDDAVPERRRSCSACRPIRTAWTSCPTAYMKHGSMTSAGPLQPLRRPRRQPRLVHERAAGDHEHQPRSCTASGIPQIMYNHHQTGPAGAVMFAPPFRDPFNYNFHPCIAGRDRHHRRDHARRASSRKASRA